MLVGRYLAASLFPFPKGLFCCMQDRSLEAGSDPVLWHCFGLTHIVRPEDFPVMPAESAGFTLKPVGFFRGNPGIDIPYQANKASTLCCNGISANGNADYDGNTNANGHADTNGHADGATDSVQAAPEDSAAGSMNGILNGVAQQVANGAY